MLAVRGTDLDYDLLFGTGFAPENAWPAAIVIAICGVAALFWLLVAPPWLYAGWRIESKLVLTLLGSLVLIATWVAVVQMQARSPGMLLALMAIVWIADTAAYFAGRRFGRHKLAPAISPDESHSRTMLRSPSRSPQHP